MARRESTVRLGFAFAFAFLVVATLTALQGQPAPPPPQQQVDAVFARWTAKTPGCAVGVASGGQIVLERAYGLADLEHAVPNVPDTVFEAGSVSKQFTAAAVLLLAREGRLSLDDPVRKYLPELPDYGVPLTIRHMLQHTSGLRDWGEVEAIAGWPRTSRAYTQAHVLDIASRQKALNFQPGTRWSYSNTGYNLAAMIVARVSGQPFPAFCRDRIFLPLGMTHTSWRDDFRRVVPQRAVAYGTSADGYRQDMPFENAYGNGGLLTTVGDLLRWNENAVVQKVGDADFLREELRPGRFNDGRAHNYALGLYIRTYKGLPEVSHSGSTAGYRAFLARYPDQHLSVAVLCNVSSAGADRAAHAVADLYLADAIKAKRPTVVELGHDDVTITPAMQARAGLYRNVATGAPLEILFEKTAFRLGSGTSPANVLVPRSEDRFESSDATREYRFAAGGALSVVADDGTTDAYERVRRATPTPADLKPLAGSYASDEAEVVLRVAAEGDALTVARRPDFKATLRPVYPDAFSAQGLGLVRFRRNARGIVVGLSVTLDRVWDLRFVRR